MIEKILILLEKVQEEDIRDRVKNILSLDYQDYHLEILLKILEDYFSKI